MPLTYLPADRTVRDLTRLLKLQAIISAVLTCAYAMLALQLDRVARGVEIAPGEIILNQKWFIGLGWVDGILGALAACLFFPYLARANHNARALGASDLPVSPVWMMLCYLVPIWNLWAPLFTLQDVWKASAPEPGPWQSRKGSPRLIMWWIVRVITFGFSRIAIYYGFVFLAKQEPIPMTQTAAWSLCASSLSLIISFLLTSQVIQDLQQRQHARWTMLQAESSPPNGHEIRAGMTADASGAVIA